MTLATEDLDKLKKESPHRKSKQLEIHLPGSDAGFFFLIMVFLLCCLGTHFRRNVEIPSMSDILKLYIFVIIIIPGERHLKQRSTKPELGFYGFNFMSLPHKKNARKISFQPKTILNLGKYATFMFRTFTTQL